MFDIVINFAQCIKLKILTSFAVSRLSSIEVVPCESASPFAKVALKIKTTGDKEKETTISIPKDRLSELLTGN